MAGNSNKAVIAALLANGGIAVAKFFGFAVTGAASMLAEGVHSVADTANQALLLWGGVAGRRAPDRMRPFGYGRERYFWAFVVAVVMFSLGGVYAVYEGLSKVSHPHTIEEPQWAIGILSLGIVLEGASFAFAVRIANERRRGRPWWQFIRESKTPELVTVLLEDFGALVGLVLALAGISLSVVLDDSRFDAFGSISIGVLLILLAAVLAFEMRSLLIGEAASEEVESAIRISLESQPFLDRLDDLRTLQIGPDTLLVAVKAVFDPGLNSAQTAEAIRQAEFAIRGHAPQATFVYIEPE